MEKSFEDVCFEFQQKFLDIFNEENNIPFLMKYYLVKEIWDSIEKNKFQIDMRVRENHPPKTHVINLEDGSEEEIENEKDLTN